MTVESFSRYAALATVLLLAGPAAADERPPESIFSRENLVAWCIVPFDSRKRGPEERAAMLERLGIRRLAALLRIANFPNPDDWVIAAMDIALASICVSLLRPKWLRTKSERSEDS